MPHDLAEVLRKNGRSERLVVYWEIKGAHPYAAVLGTDDLNTQLKYAGLDNPTLDSLVQQLNEEM